MNIYSMLGPLFGAGESALDKASKCPDVVENWRVGVVQKDEDRSGDALWGADFRTHTSDHSVGQNKFWGRSQFKHGETPPLSLAHLGSQAMRYFDSPMRYKNKIEITKPNICLQFILMCNSMGIDPFNVML